MMKTFYFVVSGMDIDHLEFSRAFGTEAEAIDMLDRINDDEEPCAAAFGVQIELNESGNLEISDAKI